MTSTKNYGDRPRGIPPSGELNTRGVAKYSDFGPIEGYISETVQDRRGVTIHESLFVSKDSNTYTHKTLTPKITGNNEL